MLLQSDGGVTFSLSAFLSALMGWAGGAVTSLLLFRARLDVHETKFTNLESRIREQRTEDKERLEDQLRELRESFGRQCTTLNTETRALSTKFDTWTTEARHNLEAAARDSRRREEFLIELVAAIAKKQGVRHRLTDVLAQLSDVESDPPPPGKER